MPPPKRPKTGLSWMAELFAEDEITLNKKTLQNPDDLKNKELKSRTDDEVKERKDEEEASGTLLNESTGEVTQLMGDSDDAFGLVRSDSVGSSDSMKENRLPRNHSPSSRVSKTPDDHPIHQRGYHGNTFETLMSTDAEKISAENTRPTLLTMLIKDKNPVKLLNSLQVQVNNVESPQRVKIIEQMMADQEQSMSGSDPNDDASPPPLLPIDSSFSYGKQTSPPSAQNTFSCSITTPQNLVGHPQNSIGHPHNPQGHPHNPQGHPHNPQGHPHNLQGHPHNPQGHPQHSHQQPQSPLGYSENSLEHSQSPPHNVQPSRHMRTYESQLQPVDLAMSKEHSRREPMCTLRQRQQMSCSRQDLIPRHSVHPNQKPRDLELMPLHQQNRTSYHNNWSNNSSYSSSAMPGRMSRQSPSFSHPRPNYRPDTVGPSHPVPHESQISPHHKPNAPQNLSSQDCSKKYQSLTQCINSIVTQTLADEKQRVDRKSASPVQQMIVDKIRTFMINTTMAPKDHDRSYPAQDHQVLPPGERQKQLSPISLPPGECHQNNSSPVLPSTGFRQIYNPVLPPDEPHCNYNGSVLPSGDYNEYDSSAPSSPEECGVSPKILNLSQYNQHMYDNREKSKHGSNHQLCSPSLSPPVEGGSAESLMHDTTSRHSSECEDDGKTLSGRQCQVCHDAASGFHYGVWSCEGCKAFFKRSIQGPVNYVCPATNSCTIDKHRRKSCQACRLKKCLEMGMSRGSCREKKNSGSHHQKRKCLNNDVQGAKIMKVSAPYQDQDQPIKKEPQVCSVRPLVDPELRVHPTARNHCNPEPITTPIHPLVEHLLHIEPPTRYARDVTINQQGAAPGAGNILMLLMGLADREVMDIVTWARGIPGYMEMTLSDRMLLLELSWMEILLLNLLWRSAPHHDLLMFAPDLQLTRDQLQMMDGSKLHEKVMTILNTIKRYEVSQEEMLLLRTCILLNAGVHNITNEKYFTDLEEKIHSTLEYTIVQRGKRSVSHMTRLLLLLPQLRQISLEAVAILSNMKQHGKLPIIPGLLGEILSKQSGLPTRLL